MIDGKTYSGLSPDVSPAGLPRHHCYSGGYIEYGLLTSKSALTLRDSVEKAYKGRINRDIVIAGVLFYDVYKKN